METWKPAPGAVDFIEYALRCPPLVQCIHAGEVLVSWQFYSPMRSMQIYLIAFSFEIAFKVPDSITVKDGVLNILPIDIVPSGFAVLLVLPDRAAGRSPCVFDNGQAVFPAQSV